MILKQHAILVVDDEEANRDMLSRRLMREGYIVACADGGSKALEILRAERFDLVMLDLMMPDMDGFQTLSRIRSDSHLSDIPIIMATALSERETVLHCIKNGAQDYIVKPIDIAMAKARIRRVLLGRTPVVGSTVLAQASLAESARVLLVAADRLYGELFSVHLKQLGCVVSHCTNAAETRERLAAGEFDLIMLELTLPDANGVDLLKELHSDGRYKDVPVLVISAVDAPNTITECLNMGAFEHLQKPFHAALLIAKLLSCLQEKRSRDAENVRRAHLRALGKEGKELGIQDAANPDT